MSRDLQESVVLISSSQPDNQDFGTGFIIYQDGAYSYLLTCAHVLEDVGGMEFLQVSGMSASVVAAGAANTLDLAVLRVGGLLDKQPLHLKISGKKDSSVIATGFQRFGKHLLIRPIQGKLGEQVGLESSARAGRIKAWDLKIEDDYHLEPGYSGSPLVEETSGDVMGIVGYRQGKGDKGVAISIEGIKEIWPEIPPDLLNGKSNKRVEILDFKNLDFESEIANQKANSLPVSFLSDNIAEIIQWIYSFQRADGSFPSDQEDTYSCVWTTGRIFWGLIMAGVQDQKRLSSFLSWLISNQNDDGGLGFIKRGDPSIVDASSEYLIALVYAKQNLDNLDVQSPLTRSLQWLVSTQTCDGGWNWFPGSKEAPMVTSTAFAILGLWESLKVVHESTNIEVMKKGLSWLINSQSTDGGWGSHLNTPSRPAPTALALWALANIGGRNEAIKSILDRGVAYLLAQQEIDGSWHTTIERSAGITISRLSTQLCLIGLLHSGLDPISQPILKGYSALIQTYKEGRFYYDDTGIFTWPTADGLMAIATLATYLRPKHINQVIEGYLQNLSKLRSFETELAKLRGKS
jgi:prenyltransferase beta subunit